MSDDLDWEELDPPRRVRLGEWFLYDIDTGEPVSLWDHDLVRMSLHPDYIEITAVARERP